MAILNDTDRNEGWVEFMRECSDTRDPLEVTKANGRLAFNALDDYVSTNATAINTAIPQPARSALSTSVKARLLVHVIRQRWLKGV